MICQYVLWTRVAYIAVRPKKVVLVPEISWGKKIYHSHALTVQCVSEYVLFNFKKQTSKKKQESKKVKKAKKIKKKREHLWKFVANLVDFSRQPLFQKQECFSLELMERKCVYGLQCDT